jgi:V/A-type H+-transporting ATPase subunit I
MIVKMNKITLLGMEKQRNALIKSLMELGVVEISPIDEDEYKEIAKKPLVQDELSAIDAKLSDINTAIKSLDKYCPEKKRII